MNEMEQTIRDIRLKTGAVLDERILVDATAALEPGQSAGPDASRAGLWSIIMRSTWTKISAAAAVLALAVTTAIVFMTHSAKPAYAIEQTIEANKGLRYIHLRVQPAGMISEAWAQLDELGQLVRLRMNWPKTEDGPKDVVWEAGKAEVWFKAKKCVGVVREPNILKRMPEFYQIFDPKVVTQALYDAQAEGRVEMEIKPAVAGQPIEVVATSLPDRNRREIYRIDPNTWLVQRVEKYTRNSGQYVFTQSWDYLEYNQPADLNAFVLNTPADVMRIDETTQEIGLPKGDLTDEQITVQVVRTFYEALIAKNYARAGQMFGGMPAAKMEELFGKTNYMRIVSIGTVKPQWIPGVGGTYVPCTIEFEENGKTDTRTLSPAVRPLYSDPNRWAIHGGI